MEKFIEEATIVAQKQKNIGFERKISKLFIGAFALVSFLGVAYASQVGLFDNARQSAGRQIEDAQKAKIGFERAAKLADIRIGQLDRNVKQTENTLTLEKAELTKKQIERQTLSANWQIEDMKIRSATNILDAIDKDENVQIKK